MNRVSKVAALLSVLMSLSAPAWAADVSLARQGPEVVLRAAVQADFAGSEALISAADANTIEIRIAGADFAVDGKKQLFRFEDDSVRAASVLRDGKNGLFRFTLKEKNAPVVADRLVLTRKTETTPNVSTVVLITIPEIDPQGTALTQEKKVAITEAVAAVVPAKSDKTTDASEEAQTPIAAASKPDTRPESQIPVFVEKTAPTKDAGSRLERLVITLGVLCVFLAAAIFGLKRWSARRPKTKSNTKIQILTQHHLGPKKSLAIIQVAGEALLVGITDQNISMLKTLALIDDEVPGHVPKNFADEIDRDITNKDLAASAPFSDDEEDEEENFAVRGLNDVRDIVSTRLKSLRNV